VHEQLCMMGFGVSLPEKIEKAIGNFREYEAEALRRDPVNGYYLCDSYGKDSGVILHLAKRAGVRFRAHHNLTTLDPPELIYFGRKHHPDTVVHKPAKPMLHRMVNDEGRGPPTRLSRWCCEIYKESAADGKVAIFGVRAAESARRKANWKLWQPMNRGREGWILNPILYWTDDDVWQYTRENAIPYCRLYNEGKTRLGCLGCPMAGDGRRDDWKSWPKYEAAWQRAFEKFWARWHGVPLERERWVSMVGKWPFRPIAGERCEERDDEPGFWTRRRWYDLRGFQTWEDLWRWWMEELPEPEEDDCQMGLF
jgi:phosphoadenosine phosphosulfate reductase